MKGAFTVGRATLELTGTATGDTLRVSAEGVALVARQVDGGLDVTLDGGAPWRFVAVPPRAPLPKPTLTAAAAVTGKPLTSPWGWSLALPARWTAIERSPDVFDLAHPGDPIGLTAVFSLADAPMADALAIALDQRGAFQATPTGAELKLEGGPAELVELAGVDPRGAAIRVRAIAVVAPHGALVIVGVGRPDAAALAALRARVDGIARTVRLAAPRTEAARAAIAGEWRSYSQTAHADRETIYALCPDGRFVTRTAVTGLWREGDFDRGSSGALAGAQDSVGTWTAVGTATDGVVRVTRREGAFTLRFRVIAAGKAAFGDKRTFFRKDLGHCPTE